MKKSLFTTSMQWVVIAALGSGALSCVRAFGQAKPDAFPAKSPSTDQLEVARQAANAGISVAWQAGLGTPSSIRGQDLGAQRSFSIGKGLALSGGEAYEHDAVAVMENLSRFYRLQDAQQEFTTKKAERDSVGFHHVRLKQMYQGMPVVGGDLIVHFDKNGKACEVNGQYIPDIQVGVVPQLSAADALAIAQKDLAALGKPAGTVGKEPTLVIFARKTQPQLTYELTLAYDNDPEGPGRWRYWIDALQGRVILRYNDVQNIAAPTSNGHHTNITGTILSGEGGSTPTITGWYENTGYYYLRNTNNHWIVYNYAGSGWTDLGWAYRTGANWGTSDPTEMSASRNIDLVQQYYASVHSRNSFDNAGTEVRVNIHGSEGINAFWDGSAISLGDGDYGVTANSMAVLDICGHEFTHGVTANSSGLLGGSYESSALNESFSDIMGTCIEFWAESDGRSYYPGKAAGTADWLYGEDAFVSRIASRDMQSPLDPNGYDNYVAQIPAATRYIGTGWDTTEEPHLNDLVQDFFFYLLCEGGSGNNDGISYSVTGIGINNAQYIAYKALTVYCTPDTDYHSIRGAWISAAQSINPSWVTSVAAAWHAVGVDDYPSTPSHLQAGSDGFGHTTLNWRMPRGATSYHVKRSASIGGPYTTIDSPTPGGSFWQSYTDLTADGVTMYYYVVSAANTSGESGDSSPVSFPGGIPAAVSALQLVSDCSQAVVLTWNSSDGATSYSVQRSSPTDGSYTTIATPTGTTYTDTSVANGTTYYYLVSAINGYGSSSSQNKITARPSATPSAPTGLTVASALNGSVILNWSAVSGATGYKVRRSTSSSGSYTIVATVNGPAYTNTVSNGTTYYYVVTAVNGHSCESASSSQVNAMALQTPFITTVAGNHSLGGSWSYLGDGGPALSAGLSGPLGITFDGSGNLWIADTYHGTVRKVSGSGGPGSTISSPVMSSYFTSPVGVALDASGYLYVADADESGILQFPDLSQAPNRLAGGSFAPLSLSRDSYGTLYFADEWVNTVNTIDSSGNSLTTIAGTGTQGFSGDGGSATSAKVYVDAYSFPTAHATLTSSATVDTLGTVYIADFGNNVIRKVSSGTISTVAGNHSLGAGYNGDGILAVNAELNHPTAVVVDSQGNLYIADSGNHRIRRVDHSTSVITTVAGTGTAGYSGDNGAPTSATLNSPGGLTFDASGNLYITDTGNDVIRKLTF